MDPRVRADMVYFKTANGGAVFSTGSISWCGSLSFNNYDNNVSRIMRNVVERFVADEPLP
jgi:N,N-dimethylformamidase